MPDENEKIYLSDSLVGVLKKDYDYREERAEQWKNMKVMIKIQKIIK